MGGGPGPCSDREDADQKKPPPLLAIALGTRQASEIIRCEEPHVEEQRLPGGHGYGLSREAHQFLTPLWRKGALLRDTYPRLSGYWVKIKELKRPIFQKASLLLHMYQNGNMAGVQALGEDLRRLLGKVRALGTEGRDCAKLGATTVRELEVVDRKLRLLTKTMERWEGMGVNETMIGTYTRKARLSHASLERKLEKTIADIYAGIRANISLWPADLRDFLVMHLYVLNGVEE